MSKHNSAAVVAGHQVTVHSGPLPDPETLERYNNIVSNAADRIIAMAETEMKHRHDKENKQLQLHERKLELDEKAVQAQIKTISRGQICSTIISLASIIAGVLNSIYGNLIQGTVLGLAGLIIPALVFIYAKEANRKELIEKQKLINQIK